MNSIVENSVVSKEVQINRLHVGGLLHRQNGKFVTVDFIKSDGSRRLLNGRLGVSSYVKGTGQGLPLTSSCITIWDTQARGYRSVNLETISRIRAQNTEYVVVN